LLEKNWFSPLALPGFLDKKFVEESFFKTLSKVYLIEVTGSAQELRAEFANQNNAESLKIEKGKPLLHISLRFYTSSKKLNIYSELYCNTNNYPVGNSYYL
jgi:GntR family transcriptional regulator/GntR family frlABCD operon transcriptional regulator